MKKTKKIVAVLMLIMLFISAFQNIIYGATIGNRLSIVNVGECDYALQYKRSDGTWSYVTCTVVGYYEGGVFHPAYCLNRGNPRSRRI